VIRFAGYGVIAEKSLVGQLARIFPCTLQEKLGIGSKKWMPSFWMVLTSSIDKQSLEKIVQCAPAVDAKMWCLSLFVTLQGRSAAR